jgi:hypothetical protein
LLRRRCRHRRRGCGDEFFTKFLKRVDQRRVGWRRLLRLRLLLQLLLLRSLCLLGLLCFDSQQPVANQVQSLHHVGQLRLLRMLLRRWWLLLLLLLLLLLMSC